MEQPKRVRTFSKVRSTEKVRYPSDISDEEWVVVAPYLCLMDEEAPQRRYASREIFNALRWLVRTGAPWRYLPSDFPPWQTVYQQFRRWCDAGCFENLVHDLREMIRVLKGRNPTPTAVIMDGRVMQSSVESGHRASFDGHKKRKGSKVHMVTDTLGLPLDLTATPAGHQERSQVEELSKRAQEKTGGTVEKAYVDQGYTGAKAAEVARKYGIELEVVSLPQAKKGFVLLPRRWVVERSFGWISRFRRLVRDYERWPETLLSLHFVAFTILMAARVAGPAPSS